MIRLFLKFLLIAICFFSFGIYFVDKKHNTENDKWKYQTPNLTILFNETNVDITRQTPTFRQAELHFSAPAVAATLGYYYYNIELNQYYSGYQMQTNVNHPGTLGQNFYHFIWSHINNNYRVKIVHQNFGSRTSEIKALIMQVHFDLLHFTLPVIIINGILPENGQVYNYYVVINGLHGDLERPRTLSFDFLNSWPGTPRQGTFTGNQIARLWRDWEGVYFGG